MSKEECNYEIYNREMLGCIQALEDWRHFLEGLPEPFKVITDHKNIEWWTIAHDLNHRQARWSLYLSRFDFKVIYKKGESMQANALSHFTKDHISDCEDNCQTKVLGPQHFLNTAQNHFHPEVDSLGDHIKWASLREAEVIEGLKSIDKTTPKALTDGTVMWEEDDGFIYYKGRLYVPNDHQLCKDIVKSYHDALTGEHPGKNGTIELVSHYYGGCVVDDYLTIPGKLKEWLNQLRLFPTWCRDKSHTNLQTMMAGTTDVRPLCKGNEGKGTSG